MSEIPGLSRAQRAYDAMTPSDCGPCPKCEAEEWRQRVLSMLDDAPMRVRDRALYDDSLRSMAQSVADDVEYYLEREDGELCSQHEPKRDDYED